MSKYYILRDYEPKFKYKRILPNYSLPCWRMSKMRFERTNKDHSHNKIINSEIKKTFFMI